MAIGITNTGTYGTTSGGTVAVTLTVAANSWLVITFADGDTGGRTASCSSSPACSWTVYQDTTATNSAVAFAFFAAGGSITVSPVFASTTANKRSACLYELTGCEGIAGGAHVANADHSAATTPSTSITTTRADSLLIGVTSDALAVQGAYTLRSPPTCTVAYEHDSGAGTNRAFHLYSNGVAVGTYTVGVSAPASQDWSASWLEMRVGGAALTGTALSSITEADIVTGGKTIIITLTGTTWVAS